MRGSWQFAPATIPCPGPAAALLAASLCLAGCYGSFADGEGSGATADAASDGDGGPIPDTASDGEPIALCGNGVADPGEECDDGNADGCDGCDGSCAWNRALRLDGGEAGARVAAEGIPCVQCPFTIEAWFRLDAPDTAFTLVDIPGHASVSVSSMFIGVEVPDGGGGGRWDDERILEAGTWHHLALVCFTDGWTWSLGFHLDGTGSSMGIGWHPAPVWACESTMTIGGGNVFPENPQATIDDLRISDRALYLPGEAAFVPGRRLSAGPGTVALWDFDVADDGILIDASGNGHDARLGDGSLVPDACRLP